MDRQRLYPIYILVLNISSSTSLYLVVLWFDSQYVCLVKDRAIGAGPVRGPAPPALPVIDLGHLNLDSATRSTVVNEIAKACHDLGYFQVCLCDVPFLFVLSIIFLLYSLFPCLNQMLTLPRVTSAIVYQGSWFVNEKERN